MVAALYREQAARFNIELIRGELLPTVTAGGRLRPPLRSLGARSSEVETTIGHRPGDACRSTPGGEVQARVRQAKHTHVQRLQEIEQARTEVQAQVVTAWSQLQAAQAAVESDQASVAANRIALAGVREEERVGQRTLLDVLNAEQELLNSEVTLATDRRNLVVASYTVLSTIGRLNAQELGVAALVYDPEQHYQEVRRKWFDISITHGDGRRRSLRRRPGRRPGQEGRRQRTESAPGWGMAGKAIHGLAPDSGSVHGLRPCVEPARAML